MRSRLRPLIFVAVSLHATVVAAPLATDAENVAELTAEARVVAAELHQQIAGELTREYAISGNLRSIVVCKYTAPELTSAVSRQHGAQVRRVTLRARNPALGTADSWEQGHLLAFERRRAAGEEIATLEAAAVVDEPAARYFRYIKAIEADRLCVNCHGPELSLSAATRKRLADEYPHDRAIGYRAGDMLGAISYKKALPEISP